MTFIDFKSRYGERVLTLAASEIVKAGVEAVKARGESGRAMDITIAALAAEIDAQEWNDVRALIKRSL